MSEKLKERAVKTKDKPASVQSIFTEPKQETPMSIFETTRQEALEDPQPGDWWNEMFVNCHLVVAVQGNYVYVLKETEPVEEKSYRYTGKIEMWDREKFREQCKDVYPYRNSRIEWVNIARKELGLGLIETASQDGGGQT